MVLKEENKGSVEKELNIYLRIAQIRKFNQIILGSSLCLIISLIIITAISFHTLIFWPDILLTILFWLFLGLFFAYSFTDDPINLIKPGLTLFGNVIVALMIYIMAIINYTSLLNILPIAYVLYFFLFISLCIGGLLTLITNIYVLYFRHKYKRNIVNRTEKINLILTVSLVSILVLLIAIVFLTIYRPDLVVLYFPIAYEISIILFISLCILGALTLMSNIYVLYSRYKNRKNSSKTNQGRKIKKIIIFSLALTGIPLVILATPGVLQIPITIEPKDYEVEFALFGCHGNVTTSMGDALNKHKVILVMGCIPDLNDKDGKKEFLNTYTHYNNTYPNITIFFAPGASPGGFIWDGNTKNIIKILKDVITVSKENNLTNVKGLTIDIEPPIPDPEFDCSPNKERHDESYEMWEDFFDWKNDNAKDFELSAVYFPEVAADVFDGDYDIHYTTKILALDMDSDEWDEHAPMIYRDLPYENPPYGYYLDGGLYFTYNRLNIMAKALEEKYENHDKLGVYYDAIYGECYRDIECNFDNLVKEALIAKHFGVPRISLFMFLTIGSDPEWDGVFEYYGNEFLDEFDEAVNGKDSTKPFKIWYKPKLSFMLTFGFMDPFFYDIFTNLNSFLGIFYISLLFIANGIVAYYGWKKIKEKVLNHYQENLIEKKNKKNV